MAMWVIAMDEFSKVYKDVEPKIKKASAAEAVLKEVKDVFLIKCFIGKTINFRSWLNLNKNNYN